MSELSRPPSDITPRDFFETWLPEKVGAVLAKADPKPADGAMVVSLEGEGGGAWTLRITDGAFAVAAGTTDDAQILIEQSVEDWRSIVTGEDDGGPELLPGTGAGRVDAMIVDPELQKILADVKGKIHFEVTGYRDRTFAIDFTFNGTAEPEAGISVDSETVEQMRTGELPPPQAFFSGKIKMTGDTTLAMQLGMALAARAAG